MCQFHMVNIRFSVAHVLGDIETTALIEQNVGAIGIYTVLRDVL